MTRRALAALAPLLAACATDTPTSTEFDRSAGYVVVEVGGDGFVRAGDRRLPLDALVLELRQRARAMTADERSRFVVRLKPAAGLDGEGAQRAARDGLNRFVDQLMIMGIRQIEFL